MYKLYDSKFRPFYLGHGDFRRWIGRSRLRLGNRNRLDKLFLTLQSILKPKSKPDKIIDELTACLPGLQDCLLFDTSWYKETRYIGYAGAAGRDYFIKVFRDEQEALFQKHRSLFAENFFRPFFSVVPVAHGYRHILAFPYLSFQKISAGSKLVREQIMAMNRHFLAGDPLYKKMADILPSDLYFILDPALSEKIRPWLDNNPNSLPILPAHGDLTPWNTGMDANGKVILFDDEQAGWHSPWYDYFHYTLQPAALQDRAVSVYRYGLDLDLPHARDGLILYLVDQIYQARHRQKQQGYADKPFLSMIRHKSQWLEELL